MENNEWRRVYQSLIALGLFVLLILLGSGMDGMSGGFAVMFVSFFLAVTSFCVALFYVTRARAMDTILNSGTLLVHWGYPEEEIRKSVEREFQEYREANRSLLFVVGGFIGIAIIGMLIFGGDSGLPVAVVLLVVFLICAIASWAAPIHEYRRALSASREAWISHEGIIYEGTVYPFTSFMMRMERVRYQDSSKNLPALLGFSFTQLIGLYLIRPFEVRIPVPPGEEQNAQRIARLLGGEGEQEP